MGCPDTVLVPCPKCDEVSHFQSKGGRCTLATYTLSDAPPDVMGDINRHAPNTCRKCGTTFKVNPKTRTVVKVCNKSKCCGKCKDK